MQAVRQCPAPHNAMCTTIRQAWGVQKGTGPTSRGSCGSRKPLKARELVPHQFPSQGTLVLYCYLPPPHGFPLPPSPHSLGTLPTHPATLPPRQQQDTWPAEKGAQDPRALPCVEGSSCRGRVGGLGRAQRREAGAARGRASQDPGCAERQAAARNQAGARLGWPHFEWLLLTLVEHGFRPNISPRLQTVPVP